MARLWLEGEARVVELELLERVPKVREVVAVDRIEAAEHHGQRILIASQWFVRPVIGRGYRLARPGFADVLDAGNQVADVARAEAGHRDRLGGANPHLFHVVHRSGLHEPQSIRRAHGPLDDANRRDDPAVLIKARVEDQSLQRGGRIACRGRDPLDDGSE